MTHIAEILPGPLISIAIRPKTKADQEKLNHSCGVHYVESLGIEEIHALFLCKGTANDIWPATGHTEEERCPECLRVAVADGWPIEPGQ